MPLPKISTAQMEREGVARVSDLAARPRTRGGLGFIFREQGPGDVGIDGHLEVVDPRTNEATGRIVGVQVKAGPSYFRRRLASGAGWAISIPKSTARYWRHYSVPVVLVAVNVETRRAYWALVSAGEFHEAAKNVTIPLLEAQRFDDSAADAVAALAAEPPQWLAAQLREVTGELSRATAAELERQRNAWRQGRRRRTRIWLDGWISAPARLRALSPSVAASLLRFGASVALDADGDETTAMALLEEARRVDPCGDDPTAADARIRAALLARGGDPEGALALLLGVPGVAARHLRAALLLAQGRLDEVEPVLDKTDAPAEAAGVCDDEREDPDDEANGWRLRAVARLALGDLSGATAAAEHARALAPRHLLVRQTWAGLAYCRGLVPDAVPTRLSAWPPAVRKEDLRRDAAALAAFADSAAEFEGVLDVDLDPAERRHAEAWRLAALAGASDPAPAAGFAAEVLQRDPAQPYVVLWAARESPPLDLGPHLDALCDEAERTGDIEAARFYTAARMEAGRLGGMLEWLDGWRGRFEAEGDGETWTLIRTRTLVALDALDAARAALDEVPPDARPLLEADIAAKEASRDDADAAALIARLENAARLTGDAQFLLEACTAAAHSGDWPFVARNVEALLKRYPTPPVRRMAIFAYFHTHADVACLVQVEEALARGEPGTDTAELQRIRAEVHARTGRVPEAADMLERLVAEAGPEAPTTDLLRLAQFYFLLGRAHKLAATAARLRVRNDVTAEGALLLAEVLAHDDPPLARELWARAAGLGVTDALVPTAITLGYRLGLDPHMRDLSERMARLAALGSPMVRQFTIEELLAHGEDRARHTAHVLALYARGEAPTHLVAEILGQPLSHLYHVLPEANARQASPRHTFSVQLRDGGRGAPRQLAAGVAPGRLALDLSALLLAQHMDVLPLIEQQFGPLRLPHDTVAALQNLRDQLHPHQPSRAEAARRLLEAERLGWIESWTGELPALGVDEELAAGPWAPWVSLLERAHREGAFVVDLPLGAEADEPSPHARPAGVAGDARLARLLPVPALRQRLRGMGAAEELAERVGDADDIDGVRDGTHDGARREGTAASSDVPRGTVLYLTDAGGEALASAGLLQAAAEFFVLRVDPNDQAARHAHRDDLAAFAERAAWIEGLVRRVAEGLNDGRYALLPERNSKASGPSATRPMAAPADPRPAGGAPRGTVSASSTADTAEESPTAAEDDSNAFRSLTLRLLADLLSLPPGAVDAVWIDDRYINRYRLAGATRVIDALEVLGALEAAGRLTTQRRFALLTELRAGNVRVIPVGADELAHHLRAAPIENGELVETRALRILRQYTGSLLADAPSLRVPDPAELAAGSVGDLELLRGQAAAVTEALLETWRAVRDPADRDGLAAAEARSHWLVGNLHLDLGLLRARVVHPDQPPEPRLSALEAASLFLSATLQLLSRADGLEGERRAALAAAFAAWVNTYMVAPRAERDPAYRRAVADEIRRVLMDWPARRAAGARAPNASDPPQGGDGQAQGQVPKASVASPHDSPEDAPEDGGGTEDEDPSTTADSPDPRLALLFARHLAGRIYDALPEAWKEEAALDQALMEFLGRGIVSSLTLGRYHVAPDIFAAAAAATFAGTPSRVPVIGEDPEPFLLLASRDGASLIASASDGDEAFILQDPAFGVLAADDGARQAAIAAARRQADASVEEWRPITQSLVADEDPARRLLAIYERRQSALPHRYDEMRARWRAEHRLHADDLRPPHAAVLRSHLRLDPSSALTPEVWERAARTLIDEEGLDAALDRLAGVPVPAPAPLLDALSAVAPDARRAILLRALRRPCSPIAAVNLLRVLACLGGTEPRYLRWALRLLRRVDTNSWKAQFGLLREVAAAAVKVRRFAIGAARRADGGDGAEGSERTDRPDSAGELLSAWYHAHRLVIAAAALGIAPDALARHVGHRAGRADSLFASSDLRDDEALPTSVAHARFVVAGLQHASRDTILADQTAALEDVLRALLRPAAAQVDAAPADDAEEAGGSASEVELLRNARGDSNLTGSWLPLARRDDGAVTVGEIVVVPPSLAPDVLISEALDALAADVSAPEGWGAIAAVAGPKPLTGAHAARFEQVASTLDLPTLLRRVGDRAPLVAGRLARQSLAPEATQRRQRLREALLAAVREDREGARNASPRREGDKLSDLQSAVLEALYILAGAEPGPVEAMRAFARDLEALGRTDAAYLRYVRPLVEELVRTRPLAEAHALTALLGAARAV